MASWHLPHNLLIIYVCMVLSSVIISPEQGTNDRSSLDLSVPDSDVTTFQKPSSLDLSWPAPYAPTALAKNNSSLTLIGKPFNVTNPHLAAPRIQCDASTYGRGLNIASCQEVWELLPTSTTRRIFGQRTEGSFDVPLPFRVLSHDGLCAVDITKKRDVISDISTADELSRAALLVLGVCVKGYMQQGGVAVDIG